METKEQGDINIQIFEAISKLLWSDEFRASQNAYFNKHQNSVTDDDENKLEYTQIHEGYVHILELIIQENLKEYEEKQIDAFYADFAGNLKKYEEVNALAVNTLFGFIDFGKFKESILIFKKDVADSYKADEDDINDNQDMSGLDETFYWKLKEENPTEPNSGWNHQNKGVEKDGVLVDIWSKKMVDTKLNTFHSQSYYRGLKKDCAVQYFKHQDTLGWDQEFMKMHSKAEVVERHADGSCKTIYTLSKAGMMSAREGLMSMSYRELEDGSTLIMTQSIDLPQYPRGKHAVRTSVFKGTIMKTTDAGDLYIEEYSQFNMGGYFPTSLLNMLLSTIIKKFTHKWKAKLQKIQNDLESTSGSSSN